MFLKDSSNSLKFVSFLIIKDKSFTIEGYFERSFKKLISLNNCWSWKADKFNSIKKVVSLFVIRKGFISPNVPKIILFDLIKYKDKIYIQQITFDAFDIDYSTVDYDFDAIEKWGLRNNKWQPQYRSKN